METINLKDPKSCTERLAFLDEVLGALIKYHRNTGLIPDLEARAKFFEAAIKLLKHCKKDNVINFPTKKRRVTYENVKNVDRFNLGRIASNVVLLSISYSGINIRAEARKKN